MKDAWDNLPMVAKLGIIGSTVMMGVYGLLRMMRGGSGEMTEEGGVHTPRPIVGD